MTRPALVILLLAGTIASSLGFASVAMTSAQTQWAAALLCTAFGTLAAALVVWERTVMPHRETTEERGSLPSGESKNVGAADEFTTGLNDVIAGRPWFLRLLGGAAGVLGLALLPPLRALIPGDQGVSGLAHTSWKRGARLVREDGTLVRADDVGVNSVLTVFPEGVVGPEHADTMANDATLLIRVPARELHVPPERAAGAPDGLIALSKVCTHAGCPVGLYRAAARQLFCPCHQSTFDVLAGGERIFGPAARGLPQLPIAIGTDGILAALGDYPEPIGPGYWERA